MNLILKKTFMKTAAVFREDQNLADDPGCVREEAKGVCYQKAGVKVSE